MQVDNNNGNHPIALIPPNEMNPQFSTALEMFKKLEKNKEPQPIKKTVRATQVTVEPSGSSIPSPTLPIPTLNIPKETKAPKIIICEALEESAAIPDAAPKESSNFSFNPLNYLFGKKVLTEQEKAIEREKLQAKIHKDYMHINSAEGLGNSSEIAPLLKAAKLNLLDRIKNWPKVMCKHINMSQLLFEDYHHNRCYKNSAGVVCYERNQEYYTLLGLPYEILDFAEGPSEKWIKPGSKNYDRYSFYYICIFLSHLPKQLQEEREVVLAAIDHNPNALKFALDQFKNDKEVALLAFSKNPETYIYFGDEIWDDKQAVMEIISKRPLLLQKASDKLKDDKEVVLAALKLDSSSIAHASERLRKEFIKMPN